MRIFSIQLIVKNQFVSISHVVGMAYSKISSFAGSCSAESERADIRNFILIKSHHRIVDGAGANFPSEHTGASRHTIVRGSRIIKVTIRSGKIHSSRFRFSGSGSGRTLCAVYGISAQSGAIGDVGIGKVHFQKKNIQPLVTPKFYRCVITSGACFEVCHGIDGV